MTRFHATAEGNVPFTAEEEAEWDKQEAENLIQKEQLKLTEYQRLRAVEYPDFRDYLDAIVKDNQQQLQAYIDACLEVKAKYPKPEVK